MRRMIRPAGIVVGLCVAACFVENRATPARQVEPAKGASKIADLPLRRPGFLFLELRVSDVGTYRDFFCDVAGYKVVRDQGGFAILNTNCGEILLSGPATKPAEIKPSRKYGAGTEIGVVVDDLDAALAAAGKHPLWTIEGKIEKRPWGVRDFRVFAPDGFYIRITE